MMSDNDQMHRNLPALLEYETSKAVKLRLIDPLSDPLWFPKTQLNIHSVSKDAEDLEVDIPDWLIVKKGLDKIVKDFEDDNIPPF